MRKNIYNFLANVFLFRNLPPETVEEAVKTINTEIKTFLPKECIYTPEDYEHKLCFIISGECAVERVRCDGGSIPLNLLRSGQSFGIMTILSIDEEFPTRVIAKKRSDILFISKEDALSLIRRYPEIAMNVIGFLANKITFLNQKIATFSSGNVEEKLANFILAEKKRQKSDVISFNCKKSAEAISAGRASLYRAISSLAEDGIIKLDDKKIYILDQEGLERKAK